MISTDVPLLFAWALALLAFAHIREASSLPMAVVLGVALGIGLNAKYAMSYFVACAAIYFIVAPARAPLLKRPHLWISLAIGLLLITPNLIWNRTHEFATFTHTAVNVGWTGSLVNPGKAAEFFVAQFGVFGPVLFGTLIAIVWRARSSFAALPDEDRLLLAFSIPIILVVTIQAFLSRAYANWAAPAYVAASILVTAYMVRGHMWTWLRASLAINVVIALAIGVGNWQAGNFALPGVGDPFSRTLGNRELAASVRGVLDEEKAAGRPVETIVAIDRELVAPLLYYAPEIAPKLYAWPTGAKPRDHFEFTRPLPPTATEPILLVTRQVAPKAVLDKFSIARTLETRQISAGRYTKRKVNFTVLTGRRGS
jgi:4-amino-4-deoxy-L-arabinose transferase-like glycosyltransferase